MNSLEKMERIEIPLEIKEKLNEFINKLKKYNFEVSEIKFHTYSTFTNIHLKLVNKNCNCLDFCIKEYVFDFEIWNSKSKFEIFNNKFVIEGVNFLNFIKSILTKDNHLVSKVKILNDGFKIVIPRFNIDNSDVFMKELQLIYKYIQNLSFILKLPKILKLLESKLNNEIKKINSKNIKFKDIYNWFKENFKKFFYDTLKILNVNNISIKEFSYSYEYSKSEDIYLKYCKTKINCIYISSYSIVIEIDLGSIIPSSFNYFVIVYDSNSRKVNVLSMNYLRFRLKLYFNFPNCYYIQTITKYVTRFYSESFEIIENLDIYLNIIELWFSGFLGNHYISIKFSFRDLEKFTQWLHIYYKLIKFDVINVKFVIKFIKDYFYFLRMLLLFLRIVT